MVNAERLADVPQLYAAGANYVLTPRLLEASELLSLVEAADKNLLEEKRRYQAELLEDRNEVLP
ncbi:hypothetical protein SDC9_171907 [bioreactor metagenome]|uniref:Uncharacterized protein n=1 Tax=bioreactor metagenome TaxID=1076179 RepID=A0A645GC53_9ZZZZ